MLQPLGCFMFDENRNKLARKVTENKESQIAVDFDAKQNLIGVFSILLEWDKRINPQNYGLEVSQNNHA